MTESPNSRPADQSESILSAHEDGAGGAPEVVGAENRPTSDTGIEVTQDVTQVTRRKRKLTGAERQRRWRQKHPAQHRAYQRLAYQRKCQRKAQDERALREAAFLEEMETPEEVGTKARLAQLLESLDAGDLLNSLGDLCQRLDLDTPDLEAQLKARGSSFREWIPRYRADTKQALEMLRPYKDVVAEAAEAERQEYLRKYRPRVPELAPAPQSSWRPSQHQVAARLTYDPYHFDVDERSEQALRDIRWDGMTEKKIIEDW